MRGKHKNRPHQYPEKLINEVREHIRKFPVVESHYCRINTERKYLESGLSIVKMYRMYVDEIQGISHREENFEEKEKDQSEDVYESDEEEEKGSEEDEEEKVKEKQSSEALEQQKQKPKRKNFDVIAENVVRYIKYYEIFNKEFNYSFYKPKKDR